MSAYYQIHDNRELLLHAAVGLVEKASIIAFLEELSAFDLGHIRHVLFDFSDANAKYTEEDIQAINAALHQYPLKLKPDKWAIVYSSGHSLINFFKSINEHLLVYGEPMKFYDASNLHEAFEWLAVTDLPLLHSAFMQQLQQA